jgi:hypothetical protein
LGDGRLFDKMAFEDGDLFGPGKMTTLLFHKTPPFSRLTHTEDISSFN